MWKVSCVSTVFFSVTVPGGCHRVVMDTLRARFSLLSGSTILSGTIPQAHRFLSSLTYRKIVLSGKIVISQCFVISIDQLINQSIKQASSQLINQN